MTKHERDLLRAYWRSTYPAVRIRSDGTVEAQKRLGGPWGILETPDQAQRSARILRNIEQRSRWLSIQTR